MSGTTATWAGTNGDWNTSSTWSGTIVPSAADDVSIVSAFGTGGTIIVSAGESVAAGTVTLDGGTLETPGPTLDVVAGGTLNVGGSVVLGGAQIDLAGVLYGTLTAPPPPGPFEPLPNTGTLVTSGGTLNGAIDRWLFSNANAGWDRSPQPPCAPVLIGGTMVDAIWRRLLDRSGPRAGVPLTDDPDLHLVVDGRRLDATQRTGGAYVFSLPYRLGAARIMSRAAVPQELGISRDPRCLGVALVRVVVRRGTRFQAIKAADPRLVGGFHAFEADALCRWTNGDALLPIALLDGWSWPAEVVLMVGGTTLYIDDGVRRLVA
jgi:hypothetical protein